MNNYIYNKKGALYVNIIYILSIILILLVSLSHIIINHNIAINSDNDNYRAGYIVESILELKIKEITELCNQIIYNYQIDLQIYNMEYIENADNNILYNPPNFRDYIESSIPNINKLSELANNPFEGYKERHSYEIDIKCDIDNNCINIKSKGEYRRARKFINVDLGFPIATESGIDEHGLPKITISPVKVIKYYQTFGL